MVGKRAGRGEREGECKSHVMYARVPYAVGRTRRARGAAVTAGTPSPCYRITDLNGNGGRLKTQIAPRSGSHRKGRGIGRARADEQE